MTDHLEPRDVIAKAIFERRYTMNWEKAKRLADAGDRTGLAGLVRESFADADSTLAALEREGFSILPPAKPLTPMEQATLDSLKFYRDNPDEFARLCAFIDSKDQTGSNGL